MWFTQFQLAFGSTGERAGTLYYQKRHFGGEEKSFPTLLSSVPLMYLNMETKASFTLNSLWTLLWRLPLVLQHHATIQQYMGTLENLLFTAELDHHILAVYQQFCALQLWDTRSRWNVYLCSPDVMKRHIRKTSSCIKNLLFSFIFIFLSGAIHFTHVQPHQRMSVEKIFNLW